MFIIRANTDGSKERNNSVPRKNENAPRRNEEFKDKDSRFSLKDDSFTINFKQKLSPNARFAKDFVTFAASFASSTPMAEAGTRDYIYEKAFT